MTASDTIAAARSCQQAGGGDGGLTPMAEAFRTAVERRPADVHSASLTFCGRPTSIAVVGSALARNILPAFAHLVDERASFDGPHSSIRMWDAAATGVARPVLPDESEWLSRGDGWRITVSGGARYLCEERPGSVISLDRATGDVVALYQDGARLSLADRARPLQRMMSQICGSSGVQDVHAALVAKAGRGVLIVGGSGRGKSSTAIDCLDGGLDFLGDDSVGIAKSSAGGFLGYSLYASARVLPGQLARWPRLSGAWELPGADDDKALLLPGRSHASRVARTTRIVAIVLPVPAGGQLRIAPAPPRDAFHALVHDSRDNRRFRMTPDAFLRITALVREVPCFRVELAADPLRVADGVSRLIENTTA